MHYIVLTTGSCGNSYIFNDGDETIIVDFGVTFKKLNDQLANHSIDLSTVKGMFLTHVHPDHSRGVGVFIRKTGLPVYVSKRSYDTNKTEFIKQKIDREHLSTYEFGETVRLGGFSVTSFMTYHDSSGSAGYFIEKGDSTVFLMTDTGKIPEGIEGYAKRAKVKFIEANYDERMLAYGPYTPQLKKRVSGIYGHLSNDQAVSFAKEVSSHGDYLYFVHISSHNNLSSIVKRLAERMIEPGIFIRVLERGEMIEGFLNE